MEGNIVVTSRYINGNGEKCKMYTYNTPQALILTKYILVTKKNGTFRDITHGESIVRQTNSYILTESKFNLRKDVLMGMLVKLNELGITF